MALLLTDYAPAHILCLGSPTRVELQGRGPYSVQMSITLDAVRSFESPRTNRLFERGLALSPVGGRKNVEADSLGSIPARGTFEMNARPS